MVDQRLGDLEGRWFSTGLRLVIGSLKIMANFIAAHLPHRLL